MGHGDSRLDTPHHAHGSHASSAPVYTPPRKSMNTVSGPLPYKAPNGGSVSVDQNSHSSLIGTPRRGRRRGRRRRGPRSRKGIAELERFKLTGIDRHDKQDATPQGSTEISEQTFGEFLHVVLA